MGVRLLLSHIERNVPNGVFDVDMTKEIENYKRKTGCQQLTIVVDLLAITSVFLNDHEGLLGCRFNVCNERLIEFFEKFRRLGVAFVFFTDGPAQESKFPTVLSRANERYRKSIQVFRAISSGEELTEICGRLEVQYSMAFSGNLYRLAKQYCGEVHTATLNECDLELAEYATRNKVFAVITNDTDFLIYEGEWRLWFSIQDVTNLRTKELNKKALLNVLGLRGDQMPIFATMSGNDIVPFDSLQLFHRRIKSKYERSHIPAVASKVKKLPFSLQSMSASNVQSISKLIFGNSNKTCLELIQDSLDSYDYLKLRTEHRNEILRRTSKDTEGMNYAILSNIQLILFLNNFDLSKIDLMAYYEMISPLIRRIMGILLMHENKDPDITRTIYCKFRHFDKYESTIERPEYPTCQVPPLEELLFEPFETNQDLDEIRLDLVCWQISPKLTSAMIRNLPKDDVINAVTLFYLYELNQINRNEADCLLLANYCTNEMRETLTLNTVRQMNERDARLAFLFTTMQMFIKSCFCSVGFNVFCSLITFDGLYFHKLRRDWDGIPEHDKTITLNGCNHLRIYCK